MQLNVYINRSCDLDELDFISRLIMSDELHFYLPGHINKQNSRYWNVDNLIIIHEHPYLKNKIQEIRNVTLDILRKDMETVV